MSASDYREWPAASIEASHTATGDAVRLDFQEMSKSCSWLAGLADWQQSMQLDGHLPD